MPLLKTLYDWHSTMATHVYRIRIYITERFSLARKSSNQLSFYRKILVQCRTLSHSLNCDPEMSGRTPDQTKPVRYATTRPAMA